MKHPRSLRSGERNGTERRFRVGVRHRYLGDRMWSCFVSGFQCKTSSCRGAERALRDTSRVRTESLVNNCLSMKKSQSKHQTCGSVRSSLSTLARLVTVGSEAVETKSSALFGRGSDREVISEAASFRRSESQAWVRGSTQVNCCGCRYSRRSQRCCQASAKRQCGQMRQRGSGAHGYERPSAWKAGTSSSALLTRNRINPIFRPRRAGASARNADGIAGMGCWKKRKPPCNRVDRSHSSPRKRADFQRVVDDERAGRTYAGGKANERG
jgi:hypothetical protein